MPKLNITFSDNTYGVVTELADRLDVPMAEVIRESISILWWIVREVAEGNKLLVQRGDRVTEVEFFNLQAVAPSSRATASNIEQPRRRDKGRRQATTPA